MNSKNLRTWGWRCFGLMWIPFTTFMIGMMGMPEGEYSFSELPALARYSAIPMAALFVGTFICMIASVLGSTMQKQSLLKNGQSARAKILDVYETGTTVNNSYLMGFELEVNPPAAPTFRATAEQLVSRLAVHQYENGMQVNVKYDPDSKAVVILDAK